MGDCSLYNAMLFFFSIFFFILAGKHLKINFQKRGLYDGKILRIFCDNWEKILIAC